MCLKLWKNPIFKSLFSHMCFLGSEKAIFVGLLVSKQMNFVGRPSQGCSSVGGHQDPTLCPTDGFQGLAGD